LSFSNNVAKKTEREREGRREIQPASEKLKAAGTWQHLFWEARKKLGEREHPCLEQGSVEHKNISLRSVERRDAIEGKKEQKDRGGIFDSKVIEGRSMLG